MLNKDAEVLLSGFSSHKAMAAAHQIHCAGGSYFECIKALQECYCRNDCLQAPHREASISSLL